MARQRRRRRPGPHSPLTGDCTCTGEALVRRYRCNRPLAATTPKTSPSRDIGAPLEEARDHPIDGGVDLRIIARVPSGIQACAEVTAGAELQRRIRRVADLPSSSSGGPASVAPNAHAEQDSPKDKTSAVAAIHRDAIPATQTAASSPIWPLASPTMAHIGMQSSGRASVCRGQASHWPASLRAWAWKASSPASSRCWSAISAVSRYCLAVNVAWRPGQ